MLNTIIWALVIDAMFCFKIDMVVVMYSLFFLSVGDWDVGISLLMRKRGEGVDRMNLK